MAMAETVPVAATKRDWRGALRAVNAGTSERNYRRLLSTPQGGRVAYARAELVETLMDKSWLAQFAPGTVGAAYRAFLERTGFSADGLESVSKEVHPERNEEHPYAWMG